PGHVGIDETGGYRVHRDGPRADFTRQGATETFQAGLGRRVVDLPGITHGTDHRADVDDAPITRLGHAAQHGLGQTVEAVEVGIDHVKPLVVLHPQHQVVTGDAGVVDQDQRLTKVLLNVLQNAGDRLVVTHVEYQPLTLDT